MARQQVNGATALTVSGLLPPHVVLGLEVPRGNYPCENAAKAAIGITHTTTDDIRETAGRLLLLNRYLLCGDRRQCPCPTAHFSQARPQQQRRLNSCRQAAPREHSLEMKT